MAADLKRPRRVRVTGRQVAGTFGLAPVLHFVGIVLCCLGGVMLLPAAVDLVDDNPD